MPETMRRSLTRRVRRALVTLILGWLMLPLSMFAFGNRDRSEDPVALAFQILGFLMFGGGILFLARTKCPKCAATLGQVGMTLGIPFIKQPNYCPYCGVSFDQPMPGTASQITASNPHDPIK